MGKLHGFILDPANSCLTQGQRDACTEDLVEILDEVGVKAQRATPDAIESISGEDAVLCFRSDIIGPMIMLIEGMIDALEEFDIILGPGFGSPLLGFSALPGAFEDPGMLKLALDTLVKAYPSLPDLTSALSASSAATFLLPPWYSGGSEEAIRAGVEHMNSLVILDDPEFVAERTRMALISDDLNPDRS